MAKQTLGLNDAVLFSSLVYACVDLAIEWENFEACSRPIHKWLVASYAFVATCRAVHWLGYRAISDDDVANGAVDDSNGAVASELLLNLRHKDFWPRAIASLTWLVGIPFFMLWTLLGTVWMWRVLFDTPECMPTQTHLYFSVFWIILCYAWIAVHCAIGAAAILLERMVRRAESRLQAVEDADMRSRWGAVGRIGSYRDIMTSAPTSDEGMTSADIQALPVVAAPAREDWLGTAEKECSICLAEFEPGELCRSLPGCTHTFHRACVDLWLLRRAECPLCKTLVMAPSA